MRKYLLLIILLLPAPGAIAAPLLDHHQLDTEVRKFTGVAIGQPGGAAQPVDRRLRLADCGTDLNMAWRTERRDTVVVECRADAGWKLFVPLVPRHARLGSARFISTALSFDEAPVIARGDTITIEVTGTGFHITQGGQALESGTIGAWIRVKPTGKGEITTCQIVRPGVVRLAAM